MSRISRAWTLRPRLPQDPSTLAPESERSLQFLTRRFDSVLRFIGIACRTITGIRQLRQALFDESDQVAVLPRRSPAIGKKFLQKLPILGINTSR